MKISTLNLIFLLIAAVLSYYAIDANGVFSWVLLITIATWFIGEFVPHNDSRVSDRVGKRYSFFRLGVYTCGMCISWIAFVHAIGV